MLSRAANFSISPFQMFVAQSIIFIELRNRTIGRSPNTKIVYEPCDLFQKRYPSFPNEYLYIPYIFSKTCILSWYETKYDIPGITFLKNPFVDAVRRFIMIMVHSRKVCIHNAVPVR